MSQTPHADEGMTCPLHKVDMSLVCHKCPWWTRLIGKHPQSNEILDEWKCAIAVLPTLLIENAQMTRANGAATESMRNNLVSGVVQAVAAAADRSNRRMIDANIHHR